jgi:hypothetical protein
MTGVHHGSLVAAAAAAAAALIALVFVPSRAAASDASETITQTAPTHARQMATSQV